MAYADYGDYENIYMGVAIAEADFPRLAMRASERVDYLTRYRAEGAFGANPTPYLLATCAIAEELLKGERGNSLLEGSMNAAQIKTEITGKHHVTYTDITNTASQEGQRAVDKAVMRAALTHLLSTGLLYRGAPCT